MSEQMTRYNQGKLPLSLVPASLIKGVAEILAFGAQKYAPNNWRKGGSWTQTYESCQRHLLDWNEGVDLDKESQLHHLKHAACNIAFLIEFVEKGIGQDDRFRYPPEVAGITVNMDAIHHARVVPDPSIALLKKAANL
jgi:hypothetical protein